MKLKLPALLALCTSMSAFAVQEPRIEEEVIVTPTRTAIAIDTALAATSVITATDIERYQAKDLPELLRRLPGIEFDDNGGRGSLSAVRIRGTETDHVLFLVDGVRISSASAGLTNMQHIPVEHIERIEVVRGPTSSLYGSDAIGGVIQIFTKRGRGTGKTVAPVITAEYGSHDYRSFSAALMGETENSWYRISAGNEETNGIDRTVGSIGEDVDKDGYRETNYSLVLGHQFAEGSKLEAGYVGSEGNTEFDSGSALDATDFQHDIAFLQLDSKLADNVQGKLYFGYSADDRESFGNNPSEFTTTRDMAAAQLDYLVAEGNLLVFGLDYYLDKVDSTANFTEGERRNEAFFASYQGDYGPVSLQAGFRHDDNEAFGDKTTGDFAIGVDLNESLQLSLSYGSAFKAPTFYDLYFPFTDFGIFGTFEGNPNLQPETADTAELMLQANIQGFTGYVAVYQTEVNNLIVSNAMFTTVENIDEADILGADAGADFSIAGMDASIGLSYVDASDGKSDERLRRRARSTATLDLSRRVGDVDVMLSWLAQGDRLDGAGVLSGYNLVDLRLAYNLSDEIRVGAEVENLFDNEYTLVSSFREFRTEGQTASVFFKYTPNQ